MPPNKGMKLTKLSAAPLLGRRCRLMPAPAGLDAGTASQPIPGVMRLPTMADNLDTAPSMPRTCSVAFLLLNWSGRQPFHE